MRNARDDGRDHARLAARQVARLLVRHIAGVGQRGLDAKRRGRRHHVRLAQEARHRDRGDAGLLRHLVQRDAAVPAPSSRLGDIAPSARLGGIAPGARLGEIAPGAGGDRVARVCLDGRHGASVLMLAVTTGCDIQQNPQQTRTSATTTPRLPE